MVDGNTYILLHKKTGLVLNFKKGKVGLAAPKVYNNEQKWSWKNKMLFNKFYNASLGMENSVLTLVDRDSGLNIEYNNGDLVDTDSQMKIAYIDQQLQLTSRRKKRAMVDESIFTPQETTEPDKEEFSYTKFIGCMQDRLGWTILPPFFEADDCVYDYMDESYDDMKAADCLGCDKYFHCKANFNAATKCNGPTSTATMVAMADCREVAQGNDPNAADGDGAEDQAANRLGQRGGDCEKVYLCRQPPGPPCTTSHLACAWSVSKKTCERANCKDGYKTFLCGSYGPNVNCDCDSNEPCMYIYDRVQWSAKKPKKTPTPMSSNEPNEPARYLFVHHTTGGRITGYDHHCSSPEECAEEVKEVQDSHMGDPGFPSYGKGYDDIGYSFLIGGDGSVFEGRGYNVQGSHTQGCNLVGYGVVFMGDCEIPPEENLLGWVKGCPTDEAQSSFLQLVSCMIQEEKLATDYRMLGHSQSQDYKPQDRTECPGTNLYGLVQKHDRWCENLVCKRDNPAYSCGTESKKIPSVTGCRSLAGGDNEDCAKLGGYCHAVGKCPGQNIVAGVCKAAGKECCLSIPYQEKTCADAGGTCRDMYDCGTEYLDDPATGKDLCPEQPKKLVVEKGTYYNGIRCCKEESPRTACPVPPLTCEDLQGADGNPGECKAESDCEGNSLIVGNKCPGSDYCCVPNPFLCTGSTDFLEEKHLADVEGNIWLEGYIPLPGSGVTIATGYDLGHGPDLSSCLANSDLWNRLSPFRDLKTVSEIEEAGYTLDTEDFWAGDQLYPKQPIITLKEARNIDCCLKQEALSATAAYTKEMDCGKLVVASLQHWCGTGGVLGNCAVPAECNKCSANGNHLIGTVLKTKTGTDVDILKALEETKSGHTTTWKQNRLQKEIDYMNKCKEDETNGKNAVLTK